MSGQKKSYKHTKPVKNFNDDFLDYIIHSVYDSVEPGEPGVEMTSPYAEIINGAKSRREARNRLIEAAQQGGVDFFADAIQDYNNDFGNEELGIVYNPDSFEVSKLKMAPILAKEMPLEDAEAYVDKLAKLMGYSDNGTKGGAIASLLKDYYGEGFLNNLAGGHAGDYSFYRENRALADALQKKFNSTEGFELLANELGYNPAISEEDLFNVDKGIPSFTQRVYRAHARSADMPNKAISFAEGFVAPQTAGAFDEGRTPSAIDILTDGTETALLGPAKTGKAIMRSPLRAIGFQTGLDLLHDIAKAELNAKTYSEGDRPISGTEGAMSALNLKERAPELTQAYLLGKVGGRGIRSLERKIEGMKPEGTSGMTEEIYKRLGNLYSQKENWKKELRITNSFRKKNGLDALTEKEFRMDIDNQIGNAEKLLRENNRKNAMEALFGGMLRTGTARGIYNPQSSPGLAKRALDILTEKQD